MDAWERLLEGEREEIRLFLREEFGDEIMEVGDSVRIIGEVYTDQVGELVIIDDQASEGDFYGVFLEAVDSTIFFTIDELELA